MPHETKTRPAESMRPSEEAMRAVAAPKPCGF